MERKQRTEEIKRRKCKEISNPTLVLKGLDQVWKSF